MPRSILPPALVAAAVLAGVRVPAAVPEAAQADPRFGLGYVVVTHYPGVRADGGGDSTAGIQAAIRDAYDNHLAVLFPPGTYTISDTLKCYEWNYWDARRNRAHNPDKRNHVLLGSTLRDARPLIRLRPAAAGFGDPERPRPMLVYRVFTADNARATQPVEPTEPLLGDPPNFHDQPNILFDSELRGLDFDCGGNRGAIGVAFRAAQESSIEHVRVDATGASAGIRGIPGRNGGAANLEVQGGDYGLDLVDGGLAGTIAVGVRLLDQQVRAVRHQDFCPLTLVGFRIVKDVGPAITIETRRNTAVGTLCAVDGTVELRGGGTAFDNVRAARTMYLRNVYVAGTPDLIHSGEKPVVTGAGAWTRIAEYAYTDQTTPEGRPPYQPRDQLLRVFSLLDGQLSRIPEPVKAIDPNHAPPPDLVARHLWDELPLYEGRGEAIDVRQPPYNARPDDELDDRAAIQEAIDAASAAGHGQVFLPAGHWELGGALTLRANTVLLGVSRDVTVLGTHASWQPVEGSPAIIETVDDPAATTTLAWLTIHARTAGGGLNEAGAHRCDRFNHLHWRAGRRSLVVGVGLAKEWVAETISNAHDYVRLTGSGGGRFYFLAPSWRWFGRHPDSRALHVIGTREPLAIYGLNLEFVTPSAAATPATNIAIDNAANVRIYSVKREMATPTLILRNSRNIGLFGHGRQVTEPFAGSGGLLQIDAACTDVTIAPVVFDTLDHTPHGEATLREVLPAGREARVDFPDCLSLYRRGALDDAAMFLEIGDRH